MDNIPYWPFPVRFSAQQPGSLDMGLAGCDFVGVIHPETQALGLMSEAGALRVQMWTAEMLVWGVRRPGTVLIHLVPGVMFDSCEQNDMGWSPR